MNPTAALSIRMFVTCVVLIAMLLVLICMWDDIGLPDIPQWLDAVVVAVGMCLVAGLFLCVVTFTWSCC